MTIIRLGNQDFHLEGFYSSSLKEDNNIVARRYTFALNDKGYFVVNALNFEASLVLDSVLTPLYQALENNLSFIDLSDFYLEATTKLSHYRVSVGSVKPYNGDPPQGVYIKNVQRRDNHIDSFTYHFLNKNNFELEKDMFSTKGLHSLFLKVQGTYGRKLGATIMLENPLTKQEVDQVANHFLDTLAILALQERHIDTSHIIPLLMRKYNISNIRGMKSVKVHIDF